MIKSVKEIASSSNIPAPIFRFRDYVRGQRYYNDGQEIDFVTDGRSLYVPATDSTIPELDLRGNRSCDTIVPERGVVAKADNIKDDDQFMLIISQGPQGIQGVQGKPGKDGKTPSVFARFDGKQMVFYTMEDIDGIPTTKRIAATNDLTGPAWKPKVINDTIVWEKSKDDETPQSIPLDELRAKEAPVLLRVNSDNTKREDETSGPANYIQWKYEGEDYWNNLISISELMNLTLAGVTIFPVQNEETGKVEYHLGHKEVTKATYDSTETGKRIITDVELGEVLFDAGKIPFPEYNYEYDIEFLRAENCDRKNEIKAIQLELPKFVKSVNEVRPDPETGNVQLDIPDAYTKQESDDKYQPKGDYQPAGNYAKSVNGITPDENGNITLNIPDIPSLDGYLKASDLKFDLTDYVLKYSVDGGSTWTTIGTTCACEHTPVVTTYSASIVDDTTLADHLYLRTTGSFSEVSSLSNLSDGTTVYGKATRSGYEDKTVSGTINGSDLVLHITGDWVEEETPEIELEVTPWSITVAAEGDTKHYTVTTNADSYDVVPSCNFITINNKTATGFDAEILENTSEEERSCTLTVTAGDKVKDVNLVQRGVETPELIDFEINDGNDITLNVGNCETLYFTVNPQDYIPLDVDYTITSGNSYAEIIYTDNGVEVCGTAPGDAEITLTVDGKSETCNVHVNSQEPTYYTLTVNGNGAGSVTVNGNTYTEPMQIEEGDTVRINASKTNYHVKQWQDVSEDTTALSPANNNFTMIKDTSINIIWEEDSAPIEECSTTVTVNRNLTFVYGESEKLIDYDVTPSGDCSTADLAVSFRTNNSAIATVNDNGYVNAVGIGETDIVVSTDDDNDTCHVTVIAPTKFSAIPTTSGGSCSINADTVEISLDQTTWTSDTISDLDNGTTVYVRASKEGYASPSINTLTINGSDLYAYPSCDWKACVNTISFDGNIDPEVLRKGTTWNCPTPTITPEGASARNIRFTSSDPSKVSVDNYNNLSAIAVTSSPVTITITADTDCGQYTDSFTVSVVEDMVKVLCSPTNTTVRIYSDASRTNLIATCGHQDTFACDEGATYYYTATASGYEEESGSYTVEPTRTLSVSLTAESWTLVTVTNQTDEDIEITWTGSSYRNMNTNHPTEAQDATFEINGNGELTIDKINPDDRNIWANVGNIDRILPAVFDRDELASGYYIARVYESAN